MTGVAVFSVRRFFIVEEGQQMTTTDKSAEELRHRAEEKAIIDASAVSLPITQEEAERLLYELRVHQVELEMQNEELRRVQQDMAAVNERYFNLYDLAPVGYLTLTLGGIIQEANLTAASHLNVSRRDLLCRLFTDFILPEDQEVYYRYKKRSFNTYPSGLPLSNRKQGCEIRLLRSDNSIFWADMQGTLTESDECWITLSDITARKLSEEALRESESNYRTLADSGQLLIWSSDTDKLCNYFNKVWLDFTGRTMQQESGNGWTEGLHPDDYQHCLELYVSAFDRREAFSMEFRLHRHDGEYRWIQDDGSPRYDSNGHFAGYIGYCMDITERKRAEEQKAALQQQLQQTQKLESLGVLAGGIAHDFNNILTVIISSCSLAHMRPQMAPLLLSEIDKAAHRAAELCRQMLAYAGKSMLTMKRVNMSELVADMAKMLEATINPNVVVRSEFSLHLPPIWGDASQLRQIVMNLIINAAEAIGEKQGEICIRLAEATVFEGEGEKDYSGRTILPGQYVCLQVTDNGCGMDEDTRQRVFEPFFTTKFTGRGLGMSAVLGIISTHLGYMQLVSQQGVGTLFKVYLPVHSNLPDGATVTHVPPLPWQGSGTILLAEDDPQIIMMAKVLIEALGFSVIEAANGQEALELYKKNADSITIVVTDVGMPVMDGYELFRRLKAVAPELPIIITSGFGESIVTSRIPAGDAAGFLSKPYRFEQLKEVLKMVMNETDKVRGVK